MAGLRPIWVTLILVMVFLFAMIMFAVQFLNANNASSALLSDPLVNKTLPHINDSLNNLRDTTNGLYDAVSKDKGDPIMIFLILKTMLAFPWTLMSITSSFFASIGTFVFSNVLGDSFTLVFNAISAILLGTIIFLVVKYIRTGESER